jgi:hypothetical protein
VRFYLNYSGEVQTFTYPYGAGLELTEQTKVEPGMELVLPAWGLKIIEEK